MEHLSNVAVLVVDDNHEIVSLMGRLIEYIGYPVIAAHSGAQAVELVWQQPTGVWCAVIDIELPKIDGIVVAHQLRQIIPELPIIFITGYPLSYFRDQLKQFDGSYLMAKPFDVKLLREALEHFATYTPIKV